MQLPRDLRQALRMLRKSPGISAIAVLSLGLGVGATSAAFSLVEAIRLRALPYPEADRLVVPVEGSSRRSVDELVTARYATYRVWRDRLRTVRPLAAHVIFGGYVTADGDRETADSGEAISPNLLELLGTAPALGRAFTPEDDRSGAEPVVLLSDSLWRSRFHASPDVLGRVVRISGAPYTVIGVLPFGMQFEYRSDFWIPLEPYLARSSATQQRANIGDSSVRLLGKLAPGAGLKAARAELAAATLPPPPGQPPWRPFLRPLRQDALKYWRSYDLAFGAVALAVLLITCANLAGLLLVRTIGRRREFAVRSALGATPRRLAAQLAAEGLALAALGGGAGLVVSRWGIELLAPMRSAMGLLPASLEDRLSGTSLPVSVAVTAVAALLVSLLPASRLARSAPQGFLKGSTVGQAGQTARRRSQHLFVALQIAGAVILVSLGGAAARSYRDFNGRDRDDTARVVYSNLRIPRRGAAETPARFFATVRERLLAVPGVETVGAELRDFTMRPRVGGETPVVTVTRAAGESEAAGSRVGGFAVDPGFFPATSAAVMRGRNFGSADDEPGARVAIVNDLAAKTWWPGEDPIGKRLKFGRAGEATPWATVVGVVENVRESDPIDLFEDLRPTVFVPLSQGTGDLIEIFFRTKGQASPTALEAVRYALREISPEGHAFVATQKGVYRQVLDPMRRNVVGIFGAAVCGLLLAAIGIYGVLSHAVERRRQEIGVRMALGASRASLSGLVLGEGIRMALAGLGTGLLAAFAALRVLQGLFFGGLRVDLATVAAVCVTLAALTLIAGALPLRRALRVDPLTSMRSE
ncbi:MAG TPA: ADOP family duplicated permease [Thermoanaerobaculia bacterium]|nr:ADOP family duplicated permease [Thermoanaerobaculia bacterium]